MTAVRQPQPAQTQPRGRPPHAPDSLPGEWAAPRPGSPPRPIPPVRRSVHHGAGQRCAGQRRTRRVRGGRSALRVKVGPAGRAGQQPRPVRLVLWFLANLLIPSRSFLAGGRTANVEPAMAVADALVASGSARRITALGALRGLETRLVPQRGYHLFDHMAVPMPRKKPGGDLARLPSRVWRVEAQDVLDDVDRRRRFRYVALPAYLAARGLPLPPGAAPGSVVDPRSQRQGAGLANRVGIHADRVLSAVPDSEPRRAEVVGVPVRASDRRAGPRDCCEARRGHFGFPTTRGCCWCSKFRRARSTQPGGVRRRRRRPPPVICDCMPMDFRTCWNCPSGSR